MTRKIQFVYMKSLYALWLGFSLGYFLELNPLSDLRFWIIIIPTIIFVNLK